MPDPGSSPMASLVATSAYPPAPTSTASTNFFGTVVPDPYRPLESIDAPETTAWVRAENAISRSYLDAIPGRTAIAAAYRKLEDYGEAWHDAGRLDKEQNVFDDSPPPRDV